MPISTSYAPASSANVLPVNAAMASARTPSKGLLHAANEFESMLLTQWLQAAESTFGSVPGAEDDEDGADLQMKSYAVQELAKGITAAGGIGLSSLVAQALAKERTAESPTSRGAGTAAQTAGAKP